MRKTIIILTVLALTATSCKLDKFPHDQVSAESMQTADNAVEATNGNYALFKSTPGYAGDLFVRHNEQLHEFKSDNILMSGKSTDALFKAATFTDTEVDDNTKVYWSQGYRICYSTSNVINVIPDDEQDATLRHIKGENLFLRAIAHMLMCEIFAYPYSFGRDNPGIVLRLEPMKETPVRATVGEVYDQIERDLIKAIECMTGGKRRGDNGYADVNSAKALLARLYLQEERWDDCIRVCDELLADGDHLDADYEHLFQFSRTSKEVLWCIANAQTADDYTGGKQVGQMFYSQGENGLACPGSAATGWGEIYYSQPLLDLFERYPEDLRLATMREKVNPNPAKKMIYWPVARAEQGIMENVIDYDPVDNGDGTWTATDRDTKKSYKVRKETVNTYPRWYVEFDGQKVYASVADSSARRSDPDGIYPMNYCKKYVHQYGNVTDFALLSSPPMLRYAEVILNRAEAYAHNGDVNKALDDVNTIRHRAGLKGAADFTSGNMAERGYTDVLDVVLDERRMELCFEGFRTLDLQRNKKDLDRRYAGMQPNELYPYNDPRIIYRIPQTEINASGIEQNNR